MNKFKSIFVYFSPAGTTRKVTECIAETLSKVGHDVEVFDLCNKKPEDIYNIEDGWLKKGDCLWIGSPIYAGHAVPPIEKFITNLPESNEIFAVPFVTYGAVTSGIGLYEMAKQLTDRGYTIPGAAKILSVHSLLWTSKKPLGGGHPDTGDEILIKSLIGSVLKKIDTPDADNFIAPETLNYQPENIQKHAEEWNLSLLRQNMPPIKLDDEKCTECNICAEKCPVQNISLDPLPQVGDNCILCFNCIRHCEPEALYNESLNVLEKVIRDRKAEYGEPVESKIFV